MNKIHFIVFSSTGTGNRQFSISKSLLMILGTLFVTGIVALCYVIPDYANLKTSYIKDTALNNKIASQEFDLSSQRQQIVDFANQINSLKQRLASLDDFEKRVRNVANLDMNGHEEIFGVGGAMPEDIDTQENLASQNNSMIREMHDQVDQIKSGSALQEKNFNNLLESLEERKELLESRPSISPCKGWYSSKFGYRTSPFTGFREFHRGLDISNNLNSPIRAPANGVIVTAGRRGAYGLCVSVDHGHGMVTFYGHLERLAKEEGQVVKRGDIIGYLGNTGRSTGPHLHYEVRLNGLTVNPEVYILN